MSRPVRALRQVAMAAAAIGGCVCACAQSSSGSESRVQNAFVGINIGKPTYNTSCGIPGFSCSNNGTSVSITAGDMLTRNWGAELSYLDLGKADRGGGSVDARGVNLSIVGRLPLGDLLDIEGKVGTTYGITHVNANPASGIQNGRDSGFGLGYGVALGLHFGRGFSANVGWEQHDFHFVGQGTSAVKNITLGVAYTF